MKVECIDKAHNIEITKGHVYEVLDHSGKGYAIINDYGHRCIYPKSYFKEFNLGVPVAPQGPTPPSLFEIKCIHARGYKHITEGRVYDVLEQDSDNYVIINDQGDTFNRYPKGLFERVNLPKPPANPNNDAYQKIVKVEHYQTTDGKEFVIENDAMVHQLMLDVEGTFSSPHRTTLRLLLTWAKEYPNSFDTLVRLVGEQR